MSQVIGATRHLRLLRGLPELLSSNVVALPSAIRLNYAVRMLQPRYQLYHVWARMRGLCTFHLAQLPISRLLRDKIRY